MATLQICDGVLNDLSRNADRPAVFTLRKRGSETWSYADLDGCVDRLARGLRHAGLARGDRAAIIADNGPELDIKRHDDTAGTDDRERRGHPCRRCRRAA